MRKLIIYTGLFSEPERNAAGKRVYGNALVLESLGYDVLMLGKTQDKQYSGQKNYSPNIVFESYPDYGRIKYKGYFSYLKKIVDARKDELFCIIRYGSPGLSLYDYEVLKLANHNGIKVVADVVDWLSPDSGNIFFNTVKYIDTYLEKAVFNCKSDGVIAISSYLSKYYKKKLENVIIIPPLVPEYKANIVNNEVVHIIYAGLPFRMGKKVKDVHKIKDRLDIAVFAIAEIYKKGFHNFLFRIYGMTEEQYIVAFPNQVNLLHEVGTSIEFMGVRPMVEVQEELVKSDFSILLREKNRGTSAGFPTKVVESMSCGTPVITTKTSDLCKYIREGENGFFVELEDMNRLIEKLTYIISLDTSSVKRIKECCFSQRFFLPDSLKQEMEFFLHKL